jgi:small subunit ribosomal protein S4
MARTLDPVCKLCRREGMRLYLKGRRCDSPKCPIERRQGVLPGMHGHRRPKANEYGIRLREKQRLKRFYGVFERQFRRYFGIASRTRGNTGEALLSIMERRLDNVVHRLGFAGSRAAARQIVTHGHILVNGQFCNIPSRLLRPGDVVAVKPHKTSMDLVRINLGDNPPLLPDFLEVVSTDPPSAKLNRLPSRGDVDPHIQEIRENLIIEFVSR